jgi:hypothetical protein
MREDPIVEEVRKVRQAHASQFNFDLRAIYEDLKNHEKASGKTFVRLAPRPAKPLPAGRRDSLPSQDHAEPPF